MRKLLSVALIALVASTVVACRRNNGPSPEFAEAQGLYDRLRVQQGDEAYTTDEMTRVEELLRKVPAESVDSADAQALLATIASERSRIAAEAAAASAAPDQAVDSPPDFEEESQPEEEEVDAGTPDAGVAQPAVGMTTAEFQRQFSRCFESGQEIMVSGVGLRSTYQLKDLASCRDRHPDFTKFVLVVENGAIGAFAQVSKLELRLPDGGVPRQNAGEAQPPRETQPAPTEGEPEQPAQPAEQNYDSIKY